MLAPWVAMGVLLAGHVAVAQQFTTTVEPYVSDRDRQVNEWAADAAVTYCEAEFLGNVDGEAAKEDLLDSMGGTNFVLDAMKEATSTNDFSDKLVENITGQIAAMFVPIIMGIFIWGLGCWCVCFSLPCCKCCRFGYKAGQTKETPRLVKMASILVPVLMVVGIMIAIIISSLGHTAVVDGATNTACTSAEMAKVSLQGQQEAPVFIGLMPILNTFYDIEHALDDNTPFMTQLDATLDETFEVSAAVDLATGTLDLMRDMMQDAANRMPSDSSGNSVLHTCSLCAELVTPLNEASQLVANGVGAALSEARVEVKGQLTGQAREDLKATLANGATPVKDFKVFFRDLLEPFVQPGGFEDFRSMLENDLRAVVLVVFLGSFFIAFCGLVTTGMCALNKDKDAEENTYSALPHRCACISWLCGLYYVVTAMCLGGLIMGFTVPVSAICLIADDLNRQMLLDIQPAIGMNFSGDQGTMLLDIVDNCINPSDPSYNPSLLDLIYERNATTGNTTTVRERIVVQVRDPIDSRFVAIENRTNSNENLATVQSIVNLRSIISANSYKSVLITDGQAMGSDSRYQALATSTNSLDAGLATSMDCADNTFSNGGVSSVANHGTAIPGMTAFMNAFATYGTSVVPTSNVCTVNKRTCVGETTVARIAQCTAAVNYVTLYETISSMNTFKCDLFEDPNDPDPVNSNLYCDPYDMTVTNQVWSGSCVKADGTLRRKSRMCTLDEFNAYYAKFDARIDKTMKGIDDTVALKQGGINTDLKNLVYQYIVDPISNIIDGITCGWLPVHWQSMVDGMCYQGVWGLRKIGQGYVTSAVFMIFYIIAMYAIWRRTVDNYNSSLESPQAETVL